MYMSDISFHVLWPGGNTTALVEGEFSADKKRDIAARIIELRPDVEQVGFLQKPKNPAADIHLEMTGGEFCGNATRSAAFLWSQKSGQKNLLIEVSGMQDLVPAWCASHDCSINIPSSIIMGIQHLPNATLIEMQGISHFVIDAKTPSTEEIHTIIEPHKQLPAVGAIFTHIQGGVISIDPYVYFIQGAEPVLVRETGCASGSIAAALARQQRNTDASEFLISQPSGETYEVSLQQRHNHLESITLGGRIENRGFLSIDNADTTMKSRLTLSMRGAGDTEK